MAVRVFRVPQKVQVGRVVVLVSFRSLQKIFQVDLDDRNQHVSDKPCTVGFFRVRIGND